MHCAEGGGCVSEGINQHFTSLDDLDLIGLAEDVIRSGVDEFVGLSAGDVTDGVGDLVVRLLEDAEVIALHEFFSSLVRENVMEREDPHLISSASLTFWLLSLGMRYRMYAMITRKL